MRKNVMELYSKFRNTYNFCLDKLAYFNNKIRDSVEKEFFSSLMKPRPFSSSGLLVNL